MRHIEENSYHQLGCHCVHSPKRYTEVSQASVFITAEKKTPPYRGIYYITSSAIAPLAAPALGKPDAHRNIVTLSFTGREER